MLCLTFDTDHMSEDRMAEFLETTPVPRHGTFFCTQAYDGLSSFEIAPHPFLGDGIDSRNALASFRDMFPKARGWRSHSCVFSHIIAAWLGDNGYDYVSIHEELTTAMSQRKRQSASLGEALDTYLVAEGKAHTPVLSRA